MFYPDQDVKDKDFIKNFPNIFIPNVQIIPYSPRKYLLLNISFLQIVRSFQINWKVQVKKDESPFFPLYDFVGNSE